MPSVSERLRKHIRVARQEITHPDNAPAIAQRIIDHHWVSLADDTDVLRHLVSTGLNAEIRAFLKGRFNEDGDGPGARRLRAQQLALWPNELMQDTVRDIDRERIWVPSRAEYVELVPDALSVAEMREAAEYLMRHGADCIRRGRLLWRLSDLAAGDLAA